MIHTVSCASISLHSAPRQLRVKNEHGMCVYVQYRTGGLMCACPSSPLKTSDFSPSSRQAVML